MLLKPSVTLIYALAVLFVSISLCLAQESGPQLQINSPADGLIVSPGQTVTVAVSSPNGASFSAVTVQGQDPLGGSTVGTTLPAQFVVSVPTDIASRLYMLTAQGITSGNDFVESRAISLDVERSTPATSLSSQFSSFTMEAQGQTASVMLLATFSDGSIAEVTESSRITYQSTQPAVANVDGVGTVTGIAPGDGAILVTYNNPSGPNVQLSIPVTVARLALTANPNSLVFG